MRINNIQEKKKTSRKKKRKKKKTRMRHICVIIDFTDRAAK